MCDVLKLVCNKTIVLNSYKKKPRYLQNYLHFSNNDKEKNLNIFIIRRTLLLRLTRII